MLLGKGSKYMWTLKKKGVSFFHKAEPKKKRLLQTIETNCERRSANNMVYTATIWPQILFISFFIFWDKIWNAFHVFGLTFSKSLFVPGKVFYSSWRLHVEGVSSVGHVDVC